MSRPPGLRFLFTALLAPAVVAAAVAIPSAASAAVTTVGLRGWQVLSSARVSKGGAEISEPGFATGSWLRVAPDAGGAPGTELEALIQNGRCPQVFFSTNMRRCFGYMSAVGRDTIPRFAVPWWFRTTFVSRRGRSEHTSLIINGVVGQADLWLNGRRLASQATVQGAFAQYTFDVSRRVHRGVNALALELHPNDPTKMFTLDNVDWTQIPPDNNTGIQFPVQLHTSGALGLSDAHVVQRNAPGLSSSALTLRATLSNDSGVRQAGELTADVRSPTGGSIRILRPVMLAPGTTQAVSLTPAAYPRLRIRHPRAWWPYQMGGQPLYRLRMRVRQAGAVTDSQSETFGIRTITTRLIGASPIAPQGSRQFLVNGRPFVFRGGGWSENLFLHYSTADTANQIALIKNLGLNGIRTEGKQMPVNFYQQMDRAGILVDAGFQCCDAWQLPDNGKGVTAHDYRVLEASALAIGRQLRNHPSILNFSWSDNAPIARQEQVSLAGFRRADFQEPLIASAEYKSAPRLGPSGEKEGPYDWVPPAYWYDATHYAPGDSSRTNAGGAWAFNSEASAGATIPTLDSLSRFLSPFEQTQLWQSPDYNQYHLNYEPDLPGPKNGGYSFGTLHDLNTAIRARYGPWSSLPQYVEEAQVQNYETQRAEFEAYIAHSHRGHAPSTGIVYWQLNKGWPTLLWDLYNNNYDQAGSYFGAQEANRPLHAIYSYDTGTVSVANLTGRPARELSVTARVLDVNGNVLDQRSARGLEVASQGVTAAHLPLRVPARTVGPAAAKTYFVELRLTRSGHVVDHNVYWLSTSPDVIDWGKTIGNPQAIMTNYADLSELRKLPAAQVHVSARTHPGRRVGRGNAATDVTITNTSGASAAAFFLRADLRRGTSAGVLANGDTTVRPVFWGQNDITLWPGESETLHVTYRRADLGGASPFVTVSGWNVAPVDVPAGP
ncbi:MAG: glycosyl hydrolase 2 galactose-binding domain-containing protein [Solirubrobacteraceae bacterium]